MLAGPELERYARQLELPGWGVAAQERLKAATAIVIGAGAVGSAAATYLACAGVGRIGIADGGWVELGDLQRAPLHFTPDLQSQKAESAAQKLGVLNADITVEPYPVEVDSDNAAAIVAGADVVLDCTDEAAAHGRVNDACCSERVPLVVGDAHGLAGLVLAIRPGATGCWRCAFPRDDDAAQTGALGAVAGVVGSLQALEAIGLLAGHAAGGRLLRFDAATMALTSEPVGRSAACSACAEVAAPPQSTA